MIDFLDIEFDLKLTPSGQVGALAVPIGAQNQRRYHHIRNKEWMSPAKACFIGKSTLRLQFCPAKILGTWNCIGRDDLHGVALKCVPKLLDQLGLASNREIVTQLREGTYRLREVHIAYQFWLPAHDQTEFVDKIFRQLNVTHHVERMQRGVGFYINPRNRRASWALYAKLGEFERRGLPKHLKRVLAAKNRSWSKMQEGLKRDIQQAAARGGPRLELRLGDRFFRGAGGWQDHAYGKSWSVGFVQQVYRRFLAELALPATVRLTPLHAKIAALPSALRKDALLWLHGHDVRKLNSLSAFRRHRAKLRTTLGVDVGLPVPDAVRKRMVIAPVQVFRWENRVRFNQVMNILNGF